MFISYALFYDIKIFHVKENSNTFFSIKKTTFTLFSVS